MLDDSNIYTIISQPANNRIVINVFGYFTMEAHIRFQKDVESAIKSTSIDGNTIDILFNMMDAMTQSQEVAKNTAWLAPLIPCINKAAVAITSTLYKMQLQRIGYSENIQFFDTLESAEQWLEQGSN